MMDLIWRCIKHTQSSHLLIWTGIVRQVLTNSGSDSKGSEIQGSLGHETVDNLPIQLVDVFWCWGTCTHLSQIRDVPLNSLET